MSSVNKPAGNELSAEERKQYKLLLKASKMVLGQSEKLKLRQAYLDLVHNFREKSGKSDDSNIIHAVAVARIVAEEIELDLSGIIAALLQDFPSQSGTDKNSFGDRYGKQISDIVYNLHRISMLRMQKININPENFIQLLLSLSEDIRVILIRLADRLYKMRNIELFPRELQDQISRESSGLYAPMAHRLGLFKIKTELEELSMQHTHPEIYANIKRRIEDSKDEQNAYFVQFIAPIKRELEANHIDCKIKYRAKSIPSIWNKMKKQEIDFDQIYDFFAIRVITESTPASEKSDCWKVYSLVTNIYQPNPSRMRDWISAPKSNGYESLHTTVTGLRNKWIEVQIRSGRMDEAAEKGSAAHWKYKQGSGVSADNTEQWMKNIRAVLENYIPGEDEIDKTAKIELFTDYVYAYTPQGDLRKLKAGSTVLDFAFDIHSEVGQKCSGAKVNNSYVTLKHVLKTGDQVEIITSRNQKPNKDWLNFVTTQKAITRIKRCLKDEEYHQADTGKGMLIRKLSQLKLVYSDELANRIVNHYKAISTLDLFHGIAIGKYDIQKVKEVFSPVQKPEDVKPQEKPFTRAELSVARKDYGNALVVINENSPMKDVKLAKCCKPVFGDEIFGFITVAEGMKIHRVSCTNAPQMFARYPYRTVSARWAEQRETDEYIASVRITGDDNIGILNRISELISHELNANIRSVNLNSDSGKFEGVVSMNVSGKPHLDLIIARLLKLKGIKKVIRLK